MISSISSYFKRADKILWAVTIAISIYCLLLLASVSRTGTNYFLTQLIAIILGYMGAIALTVVDYKSIAKAWIWIAIGCILFIVYTLMFGITVEGSSGVSAKAWIMLPGGITFQPSELVKIGFIITFSKHLYILREKGLLKNFLHIALLGVHALVPIALTHLQGDDGAAIIFFFMFVTMTFAAGIQIRYFIGLFIAMVVAIPFAWKYVLADYQKQRLINQFNPESDPLNMGYQQIQGKISIGSGGLFGNGLFNGTRVGYNVVPIQESDFIFSVAGEELGFLGCILIIILLLIMLFRVLYIGMKAGNKMGIYICFGFFGMIASQAIFNLGMCLSLLPVMGVTLPFFSAGGSSAACLYLGIGLIQNVYMNKDDIELEDVEE